MNTAENRGWRSIGTGVATLAVVLAASFGGMPLTARAQWAVIDPANLIQNTIQFYTDNEINIKEYVLDPLAYAAAQQVRQAIIQSVVNWANGGFEGSPAFVTNIKQNLLGLGDRVANRFMQQLGVSGGIDSPFKNLIIQNVRVRYRQSTSDSSFFESSRYTLNRYSDDDTAFLNGAFTHGGLRAWVEAWRNPLNNPLGAFNAANTELNARITGAQGNRTLELSWGRGLMSWCAEPDAAQGSAPDDGEPTSLAPPAPGGSPDCEIRTPGALIVDVLSKGVNSNIDSLVSADEIDEILGAVISGLTNKLLGGGGLAGLSEPSSGGGRSFIDEASDDSGGLSSSSFNGIIDGQVSQLTSYRDNWRAIQTAAQAAQTRCGSSEFVQEEIEQALERANTAIEKVETLIAKLQSIKTRLTASSQSNDTAAMRVIFDEYKELSSGNPLLGAGGAQELTFAAINSQDNENIKPTTLVVRMNQLANSSSCRP